jgi:hypothetical protein
MSNVRNFIRNLFRPNLTSVHICIFENGKLCDISRFDENRLRALADAIDYLWETPQGSPYWFETEFFTQRTCFQKAKFSAKLTCYVVDTFIPHKKKKTGIPIRYRKKMFDKLHIIEPRRFSNIHWPGRLEVKFVLTTA